MAIPDRTNSGPGQVGSAQYIEVVTPSDSVDLSWVSRSITVTVECTLKVTLLDGTTPTLVFFKGYNPRKVTRVWSTGSTLNAALIYNEA